MSDKPQKKGSPYVPRSAAVPVRPVRGSSLFDPDFNPGSHRPVTEFASTACEGCPSCGTTAAPVGRLEVIASVPLCGDCGDAWLAYVQAGAERPGASSPTALLSRRIAGYVAHAIRWHKRRVARAVAAAVARGLVDGRAVVKPDATDDR